LRTPTFRRQGVRIVGLREKALSPDLRAAVSGHIAVVAPHIVPEVRLRGDPLPVKVLPVAV
jgi:hypothetical protein